MDVLTKWYGKPETKAKLAAAQTSAWTEFTKQFPNADKTKFVAQNNVDDKWNITAEVFFKEGPGSLQSVFGSDRKYWSPQMKAALGIQGAPGFPYQLSPLKTKTPLSIPAVEFTKPAPSLKKIFNNPINIYVTPDSFFVTKFREIFQQTKIRHTSAAESKRWLGGPNMSFWPQQLNFAVFCATQGCGISREIFDSDLLPKMARRRSSIFGEGGRAKEVQTEFLAKFDESVHQPDLSASVQRYQLALDQAKVRLNFAVCPGAWLMPARMIINTESVVGYNNMLKQATPGMKLGVNNDVNQGTKKAGLQHMEGGQSKINPPNSPPSNPITAAQDPRPPKSASFNLPSDEVGQIEEELKDETPQHEINKAAVIIGVVGVAALLIKATR